MSDKSPTIYVARETGATMLDGNRFYFTAGETRLHAGHPLLKAAPNCFEPVTDDVVWVGGKRVTAL